ncbi:MAG: tRNA 5-methoxyuridine(34)/uridine 5-oxyacetic acid(34) synthase CmoB [Fibrobacteria bacterium]|nr:tRNA 5-methoxyuridine(34)/uridine 5-oxyacetic acid(34) synthase CmoB [Fibrobacteria bacterium]
MSTDTPQIIKELKKQFYASFVDVLASPEKECFASLTSKITAFENKEFARHDMQPAIKSFLNLPALNVSESVFYQDVVQIGNETDPGATGFPLELETHLQNLIIWRKGPFKLFGRDIDAEWRSNLKWDRLISAVGTLTNERVLDVGASSGYYMFRMKSLNPKWVLGIDPSARFKLQFETLQKYAQVAGLYYETLMMEDMDVLPDFFDTVFCMGILYHQRSPFDALTILRKCIRPGGRLFLETLIIENDEFLALSPVTTYAKMRNVYFIPSVACLKGWLQRAGFNKVEVISIDVTTPEEQRNTPFCPQPAESLIHDLDPDDNTRTVEGYPAPVRVCLLAR